MPFEVQHHATMLRDVVRLDAFREALEMVVRSDDCVLDVGTGTGILASFAAAVTTGPVYGIEYFPEPASVASVMAERAGLANVQILTGNATSVRVDHDPDVLVSETIGALGPEERIVELFCELAKIYPSLRTVCPSRLQVWAVPVRSPSIGHVFDQFVESFRSASHGHFRYEQVERELASHAARQIFTTRLSDCVAAGPPALLVDYELGKTQESSFFSVISTDTWQEPDGVHLYFRLFREVRGSWCGRVEL